MFWQRPKEAATSPVHLWQKLIQQASGTLLRRHQLPPDALLGRQGEEAAYWYLRKQGFLMVERNYRPQGLRGEIDLIGWDGNVLVFVEVKSRRPQGILMPEAAVDAEKERNVIAAARQYRSRAKQFSSPYRFDIVSVVVHNVSPSPRMDIEHFRDAFRDTGPRAGNE